MHANQRKPLTYYAFKCTAASSGNDQLPDLPRGLRSHFIATTVDLLSTGVDVPVVENIVFFKYVQSPIAFYQMVGRGTRLHPPSGKLMFRVYDYTNASRLFGEEFLSRFREAPEPGEVTPTPKPYTPLIQVQGFEVTINEAGHSILTMIDGKAMPVTVEEYKEHLAARLVHEAPTLDHFRTLWIDPPERQKLLAALPDGERSALLVRSLDNMDAYDLYDVLAELGYGLAPRTRLDRAAAFTYKHAAWLGKMPLPSAETLPRTGPAVRARRNRSPGEPASLRNPRSGAFGRIGGLARPGETSRGAAGDEDENICCVIWRSSNE